MYPVGVPQSLSSDFRQAQKADLPSRYQVLHRADALLDGYVGVLPVQVIQIDDFNPEAFERSFYSTPRGCRGAVCAGHAFGSQCDPELSCENNLVASPADRLPDQFFIGMGAINLGCVEQRDSRVERAMDGRDR